MCILIMATIADTAVYETDAQRDFSYRIGKLFVSGQKPWSRAPYGAEEKLPRIISIHEYAEAMGWKILGSVDNHFYEDAELIRNDGGVFEDHCMNGTEGQLRIAGLEPQKDVYVRSKDGPQQGIRTYTPAEIQRFIDSKMQIIFEKQSYDVGTNPNFEPTIRRLADQGLKKIIFNGFAGDYCVPAAVLKVADINARYDTNIGLYVVTDAIESVNIDFDGNVDMDFGKKALDQMVNKGAIPVTTNDVLEERI
jgi:nicotinamidase-related amidase